MAWTTPRSWSTSDGITAARLNDISGDLNFLYGAPRCRVYKTTNFATATATAAAVTFNAERYDNDSMHSTSSNTSRITMTTAGVYLVGACIEWTGNATGAREAAIRLNGSTVLASDLVPLTGSAGASCIQVVQCVYAFSAADYVEVRVTQSSGGALDVVASGAYSPEMWAQWLGN